MKEYIDKEKAMKLLTDSMYAYGTFSVEHMIARQKIKNIPAEDVAPEVHGKWIFNHMTGEKSYYADCSNCNKEYFFENYLKEFNYCPNCGAKMDLE